MWGSVKTSEIIEIWSDHQNLIYFRNTQKLSQETSKMGALPNAIYLCFKKHKPRMTMLTADPLSRRPDHEEGVNFNNENQILLKPEFFAISAIKNSHDSPINDNNILREVKEALSKPFKIWT